ncbi:MAG TPA: septum formation initiator family protein [Candidatus Saccharimonadales bacterium]|jgi:cell division protein FtsB|nr:septum formation initiator family protein [Candidatus Saccharimonadales bacterium]
MIAEIKKRVQTLANLNNMVLVVAVFITLSWLWGTIQAIQKNFILQQKVDDLKQEIAVDELENQTLKFQQRYLNSSEYLDLSARTHLNKVMPGEKVVNLPPTTVAATAPKSSTSTVGIKSRSNLEQWLYFLFGEKTDSSS